MRKPKNFWLLRLYAWMKSLYYYVFKRSIIAPDVWINSGDHIKVGYYTHIESGCSIGTGTVIGDYVYLKSGTLISPMCEIDSYVRSSGDNVIGKAVTLRYGTVIARRVIVKEGAFLAPNVQTIYMEFDPKQRILVPQKGWTTIGKDCRIGTSAIIGPGVEIADGCVIGAASYVNSSCLEPGVYVGTPAKKIR